MNRRQKRAEDVRAAKDKKMKKVAIGLSVVLVAVLAFEVPKLLHSGGSSAQPVTAVATTPAGATAAPTTGTSVTATPTTAPGTAAAALTPASSKLPNSDTLPRAGKSQLFAFSQFADKDPFVQQVVDSRGPARLAERLVEQLGGLRLEHSDRRGAGRQGDPPGTRRASWQ